MSEVLRPESESRSGMLSTKQVSHGIETLPQWKLMPQQMPAQDIILFPGIVR